MPQLPIDQSAFSWSHRLRLLWRNLHTACRPQLWCHTLIGASCLLAIPSGAQAFSFFHRPQHPYYVGGGGGMGSTYWNRVKGVDDGKSIDIHIPKTPVSNSFDIKEVVSPAVDIGAPSKAGGYGFAYDFYAGMYLNSHFAVQFDYTRLPSTKVVLPKDVTISGNMVNNVATHEAINIYLNTHPDLQKNNPYEYLALKDVLDNKVPSAYPECTANGCSFKSQAYAFDVIGKFIAPIGKSRYNAFASIGPAWTFRKDTMAHRKHHLGAAFGVGLGANFGTRMLSTLEYDYRTGSEVSTIHPVYDYLPYNASLLLTTGVRI